MQRFRTLPLSLAPLLAITLAGCGAEQHLDGLTTTRSASYTITLSLQPGDTPTALEARYDGKIAVWRPDAAFAILGTDKTPAKTDPFIKAVEDNRGLFESPELKLGIKPPPAGVAPANTVTSDGWSAWSGGWSAWSGGWSAWSGGWSAWSGSAGTTIPTLPSANRASMLLIDVPEAQALVKKYGAGVKIAVIDTGIDLNHAAFQGRLAPQAEWKDFVDGDTTPQEVGTQGVDAGFGHGTAVAGIIAQIAPQATILPIRALGPDGSGDVTNVVAAMDWAITQGAKIINLSLGTTTNVTALATEVEYAASQGVYVVASAGNTGDGNITYPAALAKTGTNAKYVLSVGSISSSLALSQFSCSGTALEFVAPGEFIFSAYPNNQVAFGSGTSFAAPMVAASLALSQAETAQVNVGNLENYLTQSGSPVSTYTFINARGALQKLPDFKPRKALLVAGTTSLGAHDTAIKNRLQGLGYTVTVIKDSNALSTSADGQDLVLVSATATGSAIGTRLTGITVPLISWRADSFGNLGLTAASSSGSTDRQTSIKLLNTTHPLASAFISDPIIYSAGEWVTWGVPTSNATVIASLGSDTSKAALFGYTTGAQMNGLTAPARRVGFYLRDAQATKQTALGWALFDAAVTWAVSGN